MVASRYQGKCRFCGVMASAKDRREWHQLLRLPYNRTVAARTLGPDATLGAKPQAAFDDAVRKDCLGPRQAGKQPPDPA